MDNLLETPGSEANWDDKSEEKYLEWEKRMDAAMMKKALAKLDSMDDISDEPYATLENLPNLPDPFAPNAAPAIPADSVIRPKASPPDGPTRKSKPYQYFKRNLDDYDFARDWLGTTFIRMPTPILLDDRLSHTDIAVLMALASFANKHDGRCMPSREELALHVGISIHNISRATTRLNDYGWLTKKQKNRSSPVYYHLHIPPQFMTNGCLRNRPTPASPTALPDENVHPDDY